MSNPDDFPDKIKGDFPDGFQYDQTTISIRAIPAQLRRPEILRKHYLLVLEGGSVGVRFEFDQIPKLIGRRADASFPLADADVSGRHCEIVSRGAQGDAQVTDLGSTNGTFIDDKRVRGSARLPNGGLLRLGSTVLRHEFRPPSEVKESQEQDKDFQKANSYVLSLLPKPILSGPIRTDFFFQPSTKLGGDAFGHIQITDKVFAGYLIDVSGHGVGAAMHSVSVMNVLRQRALPNTDFTDPAQVLTSLNTMFQMDDHAGMYFSIWYGVFDSTSRQLHYASAGHHPSYLSAPDQPTLLPLQTRNMVIGAMPGLVFKSAKVQVPPNSVLNLFSDGVYEIENTQGKQQSLADFLPLLRQDFEPETGRAERIYLEVIKTAKLGRLDDDFSMLIVTLE